MPGPHKVEIRSIDLGQLADSTPATHTWTYQPLPSGVAPEAYIDMKPAAETWLVDSIFTFHSNEPDVTFECKVDGFGYEPCGFESAQYMSKGGFEWGLEETEVGNHTFYVRAIDHEGNVGDPATYTWKLLGIATVFLPGSDPASTGYTPPETPFDPATGGATLSTTAKIDFEANMADATYECSLDLEPFEPCTPEVTYTGLIPGRALAARDRHLRRGAGARAGRVRVGDHRGDRSAAAGDHDRADAAERLELDAGSSSPPPTT